MCQTSKQILLHLVIFHPFIKMANYFVCEVGDQDKTRAGYGYVVYACLRLKTGRLSGSCIMLFIVLIWWGFKTHLTDCYFGTTHVLGSTEELKHSAVPKFTFIHKACFTWHQVCLQLVGINDGSDVSSKWYANSHSDGPLIPLFGPTSTEPHLISYADLSDVCIWTYQ